jgi:hypothetical protein
MNTKKMQYMHSKKKNQQRNSQKLIIKIIIKYTCHSLVKASKEINYFYLHTFMDGDTELEIGGGVNFLCKKKKSFCIQM